MRRAIAAALAAAALLVAVHVALGGGGYDVDEPPDPCASRAFAGRPGTIGAAERIGLNALGGAACELGVSRERLLLALSGEVAPPPGVDEAERADAFRSGLNRALDEEEQAGRLGGTEAAILRTVIAVAPVETILEELFDGG